jgi:hypothetical protein
MIDAAIKQLPKNMSQILSKTSIQSGLVLVKSEYNAKKREALPIALTIATGIARNRNWRGGELASGLEELNIALTCYQSGLLQ